MQYVLMLLLLPSQVSPEVLESPDLAVYEDGRQQLLRENLEMAGARFEQLIRSNSTLAPVSAFALGNVRILQATRAAETQEASAELLLDAIRLYRLSLDGANPSLIAIEDIRHNLELAKQLRLSVLDRKLNGTNRQAKKGNTAGDETRPKMNSQPGERGETRSGQYPQDPDASQVNRGAVQLPREGLRFNDPGPLQQEDARAAVAKAMVRIREEQDRQRRASQSIRSRRTGDY